MRKLCILLIGILFFGCANIRISKKDVTIFSIETFAIGIGQKLKSDFKWTETAKSYYNNIMDGKVSLKGAQAAESYLRKHMHPIVVERLIRLAGMCGFTLDEFNMIVGIGKVEIPYLQAAARGFKDGLELD